MDILDGVGVDEFTLTQPVSGGIKNGGIQTVKVVTQKKTKRIVSDNRNTSTKQSRCSDTLDWVEGVTGDKYRKLKKSEGVGY